MLTELQEQRHAKPTRPAVRASRVPAAHTPILDEDINKVANDEVQVSASAPKLKTTTVKLHMKRKQWLERQEKQREALKDPIHPRAAESSQSSSAKKRKITKVEPELEVDEEEPSAKQRVV